MFVAVRTCAKMVAPVRWVVCGEFFGRGGGQVRLNEREDITCTKRTTTRYTHGLDENAVTLFSVYYQAVL